MIITKHQLNKYISNRVIKNPENIKVSDIQSLFKIVMIGDSGTGKTSLILRFADNIFSTNYRCTIGVDFKIKTLQVDKTTVKLQVWDTAGQERFKSISQAYFRNS